MNPGWQLDAMIAEKVMGIKVLREDCWGDDDAFFILYFDYDRNGEPDEFVKKVPRYSTDIAAAWEVVERLGAKYQLKLNSNIRGWYAGLFDRGHVQVYGQSDTAPHAICLAALKAVGA